MAGFYNRCRAKRNLNQTFVVFILICSCFPCLNVCVCVHMFEVRSCRWCEVAADGFLNLTAFLLCKSALYETHTCLGARLCATVSVFCAHFGLI